MTGLPHIVIVGGGFGGLYAARALRDAPVRVTLVDRRNFHLFQPLLYQVATGTLSDDNITLTLRSAFRRQRNAAVLLGEMTGLDAARKEVVLKGGRLPYDSLIVAAGSEPHYFGREDWRSLAPGLKNIEDAVEIRSRILRAFESAELEKDEGKVREWLTFVIVGAGPTGVELAGALAETARKTLREDFRSIRPEQARIFLVSSKEHVLPTYPAGLSVRAEEDLARLGVSIKRNVRVTEVLPDAVVLGGHGAPEERVATRTVLWAAGVRPSPLGRIVCEAAGTAPDPHGRVAVSPDLSVPGHPEVFVIGDLAAVDGVPGVAQAAIQEGRYVGRLIRRRLEKKETPPFRYLDLGSLATIGRNAAVADLGWARFSGLLAWLVWALVHLLYLTGFKDRMFVFIQWAWSYLTWDRSNLLIIETDASEK